MELVEGYSNQDFTSAAVVRKTVNMQRVHQNFVRVRKMFENQTADNQPRIFRDRLHPFDIYANMKTSNFEEGTESRMVR